MVKPYTKKCFVCSPLSAPTAEGIEANIELAKRLCRVVVSEGHAPFAPHIFYTLFLDETKAADRERGITCGMAWLGQADLMWVFASGYDSCSAGMKAEIDRALKCAIPPVITYLPIAWHGIAREYGLSARESKHGAAEAAALGGLIG